MDTLPASFLARFSLICSIQTVQHLMVTRYLRKRLKSNHVWLKRCETIPAFGELTEYERKVMMQKDGFWYDWYIDHMTVRKSINPIRTYIQYPDEGKLRIPVRGNLLFRPFNGYCKTFVVTEVRDSTKLPFKFKMVSCRLASNKKSCLVMKDDEQAVTLRKGGNMSQPLHFDQ